MRMICCESSARARRICTRHCERELSVTAVLPCGVDQFLLRHQPTVLADRNAKTSKAFGCSGTSSLPRRRKPLSASSTKSPKRYWPLRPSLGRCSEVFIAPRWKRTPVAYHETHLFVSRRLHCLISVFSYFLHAFGRHSVLVSGCGASELYRRIGLRKSVRKQERK